ncbi:MAG: chromate transporter [Alphaproteobacteria bacterium]|nr:chromate transporter [Alphaproteobacteria bacterium]
MPLTAENGSTGGRVTLKALFVGFLKVSLCGFGGGLVWARRVVVEQRQWMGEHEFAETLTLCQLLPGPNIVGIAVCVGAKLRGAIGAAAAVAGFVLIPWSVGLALGAILLRHAEIAVLQNILGGLSAAAAGLLIGTGLRLLMPYRSCHTALLFAGLAFAGMAFTKLPLPLVLLALAPLSIAVARLEEARGG